MFVEPLGALASGSWQRLAVGILVDQPLAPGVTQGFGLVEVGCEIGLDLPVFVRDEGLNFLFSLGDEAHRHRLHAPGAEAAGHFFPQERRNLIPDDPIQNATRLLGVDLVQVDRARVFKRLADLVLRDRVEDNALGPIVVDAQGFLEVPGDRLSLPIKVGGEVDVFGGLRVPFQFRDGLFLGPDDFVGRLEAVFDIHPRHRLLGALGRSDRQVPNVADRGFDHVIVAEVLVDGAGFGRRFNDDQMLARSGGLAAAFGAFGAFGGFFGLLLFGHGFYVKGPRPNACGPVCEWRMN